MRKFWSFLLLIPSLCFAQSYPSPTFNNVTINGNLTPPAATKLEVLAPSGAAANTMQIDAANGYVSLYSNGPIVSTGTTWSHANQSPTTTTFDYLGGGAAEIAQNNASASANNRLWSNVANSDGYYHFRTEDDAETNAIDWLTVYRNGLGVTWTQFSGGTNSSATPSPNMTITGTWNNSASLFTGIKINPTVSNSYATGSRLFDMDTSINQTITAANAVSNAGGTQVTFTYTAALYQALPTNTTLTTSGFVIAGFTNGTYTIVSSTTTSVTVTATATPSSTSSADGIVTSTTPQLTLEFSGGGVNAWLLKSYQNQLYITANQGLVLGGPTTGTAATYLSGGNIQIRNGVSVGWTTSLIGAGNDVGFSRKSTAGFLQVNNGTAGNASGNIEANTVSVKGSYTVSSLATAFPCSSTYTGMFAVVTDATVPTYNATLTGGGAVTIPVFCNGSNWVSH